MAPLSSSRAGARTAVNAAKADAVLWILAGIALALLVYEIWTLGAAVLLPLLANANVLQTDFHYYYDAATRFRADSARLYLATDDVIAGFAYPPPAIVPFVWLSHLSLGAALWILTLSSYAVLIASIVLWLRYLNQRGVTVDWKTGAAASLIAIALGPTYSNAIFGQVNVWVLACAVIFVTIGPTRPALGGVFLALGTWLKIYPIVMVAVGLWNRSAWSRIAYAAAASVIIVLVALPIVPLSSYETFWTEVLPARFDKTAVHISNQSLIAFLERFGMPAERFLNWTGEQAVETSGAVRALNWAFGIAVMAVLWHRAGRGPRVEAVDSAAGLIALAAVIAPLGWGHTYVLVLPLVILHLVSLRHANAPHAAVVWVTVVALMIPAGRRFSWVEVLPATLQNIVYSRYLFATLLLIALPPPIAANTESRRPT
jgi:alpha-1,2-mannosyltransferase